MTSHTPKSVVISFGTILLVCLLLFAILVQWEPHTSDARPADQYAGIVELFQSSIDKDQDGIDDQTDILEGALAYIHTKPIYESRYYASGYPDDGSGVCTDVVAQALKAAGYDLKTLVHEDILANGTDYNIETPDPNIDFRRVPNLNMYFSHTAITLTTDLSDIDAWQGGDIVVFRDHIGIISDRRNARGIPYVIHHAHKRQTRYEQDILEKRQDLTAHYRISE